MHSDMLFFWLCFHLSSSASICQGVHGVWIAGRLVLWFEGVEELDPPLLLTLVLGVDPLRMVC